jgi:uncharacterized membrane protein
MPLAFRFAWQALWRHFGLFAGILLLFVAAWVLLEVVVIGGEGLGPLLWAGAHSAFLVVFAGLELGLLRVSLDIHDGKSPTLATAFERFRLGPVFLLGQVACLALVGIGLALLIVPGLYLLARFGLFGFGMADGEPSLIASLKQSATLSDGAILPLIGITLVLLLLNLLGAALLGMGLFVTIPFTVLALSAVYRQLQAPISAR